jgi:exopolysaccharide production protein ExoQ
MMPRGRPVASRTSGMGVPPTGTKAAAKAKTPLTVTVFMWILIVFTIVPEGFHYGDAALANSPTANLTNAAAAMAMPTEGSPLSRGIWLALLAFGLVTVASRSRAAMKLLKEVNPYLLLFMGLIAISIVWSIEPAITARRVIRSGTIVLDALAFALLAKHPSTFQRTLRPILLAVLVGSIIFVIEAPNLAVEQLNQAELVGAWHGLAVQKNGLGSLAALGLVLWLHGWLSKESNPLLALFGMTVSAICLVKSRSSTSLMGGVFACTLLVMLLRSPPSMRRYLPYIVGVFVLLLLTYSLAVLNLLPGSGLLLSPITAITGKDQTFSGRTAIWTIIDEHIHLHPLLGTGYGAYWVQVPESPSLEMIQRLYWYPTESHNGYLDVINDLGYVGGVVLIAYLVAFVRQGLRIFRVLRPQGALFLALIFEQMIANLSEARWFNALCNEFVVLTIATVAMAGVVLYNAQQAAQWSAGRAHSPAAPAAARWAPAKRRPPRSNFR